MGMFPAQCVQFKLGDTYNSTVKTPTTPEFHLPLVRGRVTATSVAHGLAGENHMDDHGEPRTWTEQLLLTAEEAAGALHVGRTTLFALIKNGELHAVHIGRSCRLTRAEWLRYVARLDSPSVRPRSGRLTAASRTRTSVNRRGLFDLEPTPPDAA
jgi:excisionase family DNA binding protein